MGGVRHQPRRPAAAAAATSLIASGKLARTRCLALAPLHHALLYCPSSVQIFFQWQGSPDCLLIPFHCLLLHPCLAGPWGTPWELPPCSSMRSTAACRGAPTTCAAWCCSPPPASTHTIPRLVACVQVCAFVGGYGRMVMLAGTLPHLAAVSVANAAPTCA
jgi:hypothetical protein